LEKSIIKLRSKDAPEIRIPAREFIDPEFL